MTVAGKWLLLSGVVAEGVLAIMSVRILPKQLMTWLVLSVACLTLWACPARAGVDRDDKSALSRDLGVPLTVWSNSATPQGVVVAVHGVIMHGGSFDVFARSLADRGYLVVAPDLRGYGRWHYDKAINPKEGALDYERSYEDLAKLVARLHQDHPGRPLFLVGESLGADLALRLASRAPQGIDGLVLSSPAIKRRIFFLPRMVLEAAMAVSNPHRQIDLTPYIKRCASEDPAVSAEILSDPLTRKALSALELFSSMNTARTTMDFVDGIPAAIPVLVIQGSADRTIKANAVVLLLSHLRSGDQTVKWFPGRGHVLLETAHMQPNTREIVSTWIEGHTRQATAYQVESVSRQSPSQPD